MLSLRLPFVIFVIAVGALVFSAPLFVSAQGSGLSISPLNFELTANPGENLTNVVKVFNGSSSPAIVAIEVEDFRAAGERGEVALEPGGDTTYSLARWVHVVPQTFVLEPGAFRPVEFTVAVPPDAEPGGHYGSILASFSTSQGRSGAIIAQKVGSLLLMQVAGDVHEEMRVKSMEAPSFSEYGPVVIGTRFENIGSVHVKPRGFILIKNMFGREVAELNVTPSNVLPESVRLINTEFGSKWLLGKYSAQLTVIYGSENTPLIYSTSFWVFPWKIGAGVFAGLLVVGAMLFIMRRRIGLALRVILKGQ